MAQLELKVYGMSCTGCEIRIEEALKKLNGVKEVKAFHNRGRVFAAYDEGRIGIGKIADEIEKLGYRVGSFPDSRDTNAGYLKVKDGLIDGLKGRVEDGLGCGVKGEVKDIAAKGTSWEVKGGSKPSGMPDNAQLIGIVVIFIALYLVIKNTIGFNFIPEIDRSMGYGLLFVSGLLTSFHCIAMCGGINLSVSIKKDLSMKGCDLENPGSLMDKYKSAVLYNIGRIISYTLVGGSAGLAGSVVGFSGTAKGLIAVISGIFMLVMGLNMLGIFPWLGRFIIRMPRIFGRKAYGRAYSGLGGRMPLIVGLMNGLMPCGPLQAMQLYALGTGSFYAGAASMFMFSLGTVPLMLGFGIVSSHLGSRFRQRVLKAGAVIVMLLGLIMLNRGLNLSGWGFAPSGTNTDSKMGIAAVEGNLQKVTTRMEAGYYAPVVVLKGIPVRWTIIAEKEELNGCNNPLTIPGLGIVKKLEPGETVIEFTPDAEGDIIYTCWMGMITGRIRVVEDISDLQEKDLDVRTFDF